MSEFEPAVNQYSFPDHIIEAAAAFWAREAELAGEPGALRAGWEDLCSSYDIYDSEARDLLRVEADHRLKSGQKNLT